MFLSDSLFRYRSTEPIWFRYLRSLIAIIFSVMLIFYVIYQLNELYEGSYVITTTDEVFYGKNKIILFDNLTKKKVKLTKFF